MNHEPVLPGLFTPPIEAPAAPQPTVQERELNRVRGALGAAIVGFWRFKLTRASREFTAEDLRLFVLHEHAAAPASADRVMRDLRARGAINYRVINRAQSRYEALPLKDVQA